MTLHEITLTDMQIEIIHKALNNDLNAAYFASNTEEKMQVYNKTKAMFAIAFSLAGIDEALETLTNKLKP